MQVRYGPFTKLWQRCKMFLCAACHAFTPHVNAWKNLIGIVVQIQARG